MPWQPGSYQYYGSLEHPFVHSWIHCSGKLVHDLLDTCGVRRDLPLHGLSGARFEHHLKAIHFECGQTSRPDRRFKLRIAVIVNLRCCLRTIHLCHLRNLSIKDCFFCRYCPGDTCKNIIAFRSGWNIFEICRKFFGGNERPRAGQCCCSKTIVRR